MEEMEEMHGYRTRLTMIVLIAGFTPEAAEYVPFRSVPFH
jgi:hypothetical protein